MISEEKLPYLFALGANLSFAIGSQVFTHYARQISSTFMNVMKVSVAIIGFFLIITFADSWHTITLPVLALFMLSGTIGLGVGDIFLLQGFAELGPGRTMMLYSFQPIILGLGGYFLFGQVVDPHKFWAILCFMVCLFAISLESFKKIGHWGIYGISMAGLGILFDGAGVLITRHAFNLGPDIWSVEGNFYRALGAVIFFVIYIYFRPINFFKTFFKQSLSGRWTLIGGSIFGTCLSLSLYLVAIQKGNLASISGLAMTGTIFSTILESIIAKKWPSKYFYLAFIFFLAGMKILIF
jgi:drug/metabolite transporter (DMT)-like permease